MTQQPPPDEPRDPDEKEPESPPWAWEPKLGEEPGAAATEPPPPADGSEMLERLRERGLISDQEPAGAAPADIEPGAPVAPETVAAAESAPPPPPEAPVFVAPTIAPPWTPPPPPPPERYPMHFDVAYPERLSRLSTFFRIFLLVPVYIFMQLVSYLLFTGLLVGFTTVFWRRKYPRWLFQGMSGAFGFQARSYAYWLLLTDKFPSFSPDDSAVVLEFDEPPSGQLSRWRVLFWKLILILPHFFVLYFLAIAVFATTFISWFGILITGNYPRGLFQFSVGIQRWYWRIASYFASFNDRFPPYALSANAGPASNGATVANGFVGAAIAASVIALFVTVASLSSNAETIEVDYAQLQAGRDMPSIQLRDVLADDPVTIRLMRAVDPGDDLIEVIRPAPSERVIVFQWTIVNSSSLEALVVENAARLKYEDGDDTESVDAIFIGVNNRAAPANIRGFGTATVQAAFIVPEDAEPLELRFRGGFANGGVKYIFD